MLEAIKQFPPNKIPPYTRLRAIWWIDGLRHAIKRFGSADHHKRVVKNRQVKVPVHRLRIGDKFCLPYNSRSKKRVVWTVLDAIPCPRRMSVLLHCQSQSGKTFTRHYPAGQLMDAQ